MLPEWMAVGLTIAGGLAVVFAVLFVAGERLFPTAPRQFGDERSGEWKRRQEIREYLAAIDEQWAEDHFVAGQHVAFYLPRHDVAITFDALAYFRIEKTDTYAILVEHEMPGYQLGARLPFETPDLAPDRVDSVGAAFALLGLAPGASRDEVKSAYRERIKEAHPDNGGDQDTFKRVREAYTAAKQHATAG